MPSEDAATSTGGGVSVRTCPVQRGHSDSSVPSCRSACGTGHAVSAREDIWTRSPPPCTCGNHNASTSKQTGSVPLLQRVKARRNLQLPSFKSLGIAAGIGSVPSAALTTGALPTPPEEAISSDTSLTALLPGQLSRSISFTEGILPTTPGFHEYSGSHPSKGLDEAARGMSEHSTSATPDANPTATTPAVQSSTNADPDTPRADIVVQDSSEKGGDDSDSDDSGFVIGAISFTGQVVTDLDATVLHAMCYTQPCPLAATETAFDPVLADMEDRAKRMGKYIEVTYQMPPNFNMNQIPTSPAATPTMELGGPDYFGTHVYTRGIVAHSYEAAMAQAGSSSPCPAVAPGSINVAMLERYIPPPSLDEYTNLFSTDMPSALVDRLFELSPKDGTLIFVYPTAHGAKTFFSTYLHPLLDPLLRTIASTHDLSADLPASVGALASLQGELLPFDRTITKLTTLLRRLSRPPSIPPTNMQQYTARPTPTFTLVHSDRSVVDIGKDTLVNWWLEQEKGRIRKAVDRYFTARRAESTMGMTAKIEDGLRRREYCDYDPERGGIEVGVYVVRRSS